MKKICSIICLMLALAITGCGVTVGNISGHGIVDEKFMVHSLPWGEKWENIKDTSILTSAQTIIDDGNRFAVEIAETEFLGLKGRMVLEFSESENAFPASGLTNIYFAYEEQQEQSLLEQGEKIYGERKNYFLDKNGVENPLNPPSWYSAQNIENSLTEEEEEHFRKILKDKNVEETRADAILRGPLVVISVNEDDNIVTISGNKAAEVKNLREGNIN